MKVQHSNKYNCQKKIAFNNGKQKPRFWNEMSARVSPNCYLCFSNLLIIIAPWQLFLNLFYKNASSSDCKISLIKYLYYKYISNLISAAKSLLLQSYVNS